MLRSLVGSEMCIRDRSTQSTGEPSTPTTVASDYKDQLTRFYQRYAPHKLPDVERNLSRFAGNEKEMFEILHKKYGVEPETSVANNVVSEVSNRNNSMSHKERLTRFYQQYDPHNLGNVDATLRAYAGREEAMFKELVEKYGEPSTPTTVASDYKDQLTRFYQRYAPHKLPDVERNLSRFAGNEKEMFEILHKKYGVEPETSVANNVVSEVPRSNPETRGVFLSLIHI
eukprot:TRINITY_DN6376_c0_g1_i1.p1 TRINITY_DN6376_c0_g1~~TRINITY_DN6376_c0_g1_i1.p1  ORF type:complete len:228 (+),score=36.59 TRINITY_DN6376_c0_g1_i1:130-813(+)